MNTVLVAASVSGRLKDLLASIHEYNTSLQPHKQTPLRQVRAALRSRSDGASTERLDTVFIYQQRPADDETQQPLYESVTGASSVEYPVAAEMEFSGEQVLLRASARNNVLSPTQTKALVEDMDKALRSLMSDIDVQAVTFGDDGKATICGLQPITLIKRSEKLGQNNQSERKHQSEIDISNIKDILVQVSGAPPEEITAGSPVESLGIDSVSAIKLSALLKKAGMRVRIRDLLQAKTASDIARLTTQVSMPSNGSVEAPDSFLARDMLVDCSLSKEDIEYIIPALAGQIYMLSVWLNTRGRLFYPTFSFELDGDMKQSQIDKSWRALLAAHPVLRTSFWATTDPERPVAQVVLRDTARRHDTDANARPLSQPWVDLQAERHDHTWILRLKIHHALYDAISLPLLIHDLQDLLNDHSLSSPRCKPIDLVTPTNRKSSAEHFWKQYLSHVNRMTGLQSTAPATQRTEIFQPAVLDDASALQQHARKHKLNIQSILFAAWAKVLAAQPDQDVVLGIYFSNRSHMEDLLEARAPTLNLLPLVVRQAQNTPLKQLAEAVQRDLASIGAGHNFVSLWEIEAWTGVQLDVFVNFVQLPSGAPEERQNSVRLKSLDGDKEVKRSGLVPIPETHDFSLPSGVQKLPSWPEVYKDTLDIEMTVAHGSLDVGMFALESIITPHAGQSMLAALRDVLRDELA